MAIGPWLALAKRWRRWLIVVGVLMVVRAALPEVLRRVIVSQASQALRTRVDLGDVDLALVRGGVELKDFAIHAPSAGQEAPAADTPVLIGWKRLAVELRWLKLFSKTIELREGVLESPRVALDRLADGGFNLLALVPASAPASPTPEAAPPAKSSWAFGLDRFVLIDGGVLFRDLSTEGSEPINLDLNALEVHEIELRPGVYGQPAQLHLKVTTDQASVELDARLTLREDGYALEAALNAQNLPLRRARFYIPKVGWSALEGQGDATLTYHLDTGKQNELRGTVAVRDLAVRIPQIEQPGLAWKSLTVTVDPVDLLAHRATITDVTLSGASLLVRPKGGVVLPLLASAVTGEPAPGSSAAPDATPEAPAAPPTAPTGAKSDAAAWQWSLASLRIDDAHVRLLPDLTLDIGIGMSLKGLADPEQQPAHIELTLAPGAGSIKAEGALQLKSPGFAGTVQIAELSIPELIAASGAVSGDLLQAAYLSSNLAIEAGLASGSNPVGPRDVRVNGTLSLANVQAKTPAPYAFNVGTGALNVWIDELLLPGVIPGAAPETPPPDVRFRGRVGLADLRVAAPAPQALSIGARTIELALGELTAPATLLGVGANPAQSPGDIHVKGQFGLNDLQVAGADPKIFSVGTHIFVLPIAEVVVPGAATQPLRVALGDVQLSGPTVRITRTADGLVLPKLGSEARPQPAPTPLAQSGAAPVRPIEVAVKSFRLAQGSAAMTDRTVKPFFAGRLGPLDVSARDVRWPQLALSDLRASLGINDQGTVKVYGGTKQQAGWFEVNGDSIALTPFNPYVTSMSSYGITGGTLSVATKGSFAGDRYDTDTWLTLHDFDVSGAAGDSLFQQQFGIPLTMALALMRDLNGDIGLGIPVQVNPEGTRVDVLSVVGVALRHAIVNALASPLKLVGAAFGGGKEGPVAPAPILFRLGRAAPTTAGAEQIDQLGGLLASRAGLGVTLDAKVTASDVRWLREQALRAEWAQQGMFAKLGGLTQRGTRERVRKALEARANDEPGELSADDGAALDRWIAERPSIPPDQLEQLVAARTAAVEQALVEQHGIDAQRILRQPAAVSPVEGDPTVGITVGAARR